MKRSLTILFTFLCLLVVTYLHAQSQQGNSNRSRVRGYTSQQEIVNMDSSTRMDQAVLALNEMAKKFAGKSIVDLQKSILPIGIDIVNQQWRDALETILMHNNLWYREDEQYIVLMTAEMANNLNGPAEQPGKKLPTLDSREVLISTTFISVDVNKSTNLGVDWSFAFAKNNDTVGASLFAQTPQSVLDLTYGRSTKTGSFTSLIQLYQQNGVGEVIATPRVSVLSGDTGIAQVGTDVSVLRRDVAAGGTISISAVQIPTGTIVKVRPIVIHEDTLDFIYLDLEIERSVALTTGELPSIDRNKTKTKLLLVDGEEAFISGLYFNQDNITRTGVPFLKDLPWYFLGLRYLFGSDEHQTLKKELAILIKAEIVPSLRDRNARKGRDNVIEQMRRKFEDEIERMKIRRDKEN